MARTTLLLLAVLAAAPAVGCKGIQRPASGASTDDQDRRDRAQSGLYQDDRSIGPRTNSSQPDPVGIGTASPRNGVSPSNQYGGAVWRY